ncbi:MAG TPA: diadenylate cyclase CdaA [Bellilinea sp.]|nr:diadenylate cyclase CdaA [Bellilinea sp.]
MTDLLNELGFIFQRFTWQSALDIFLVALVFFAILLLLKDTQIMVLLRGVIIFVVVLGLITSMVELRAFGGLLKTIMPVLVLAIPVIFAPEIRRGLERLGRAGNFQNLFLKRENSYYEKMSNTIHAVVSASSRLASKRHGALIILQRTDSLRDFVKTGVAMDSVVTPEVLLQIFYPNTPLHDGGVIINGDRIEAAACVMPLSSSGVLNRTPDHQMGLRHRAALGTSEASDAIVVVVSEETGSISIAHAGRMIRKLDSDRLENILLAFFQPPTETGIHFGFGRKKPRRDENTQPRRSEDLHG